MTAPPFAQLQVSIAGGGAVSGGLTAAFGNSIAITPVSTVGWTAAIYEIYDFPPGFTAPAGWSTASSGVIYFRPSNPTTPPPSFNWPASGSNNWGPMALRLRINDNPAARNANGSPNTAFVSQYTDESTTIMVPSPSLAMPGVFFNETTQYDTLRQAVGPLMICLRKLDVIAGGGGTVSVTGSGLLHASSSVLDSNAYKGTAGQIVVTNAGATDTPWVTVSQDATLAASGAVTVVGLRGNALPAPSGTGTAIVWNGSSLSWANAALTVSGSGMVHVTGAVVDAAASRGTAGQMLATNAAATDTAWVTATGDVSLSLVTPGLFTVVGIQTKAVPAPSGTNTTLLWSGTAFSWGTASLTVTGSGFVHFTAGVADAAASHGTANQVAVTNGIGTDTTWVAASSLAVVTWASDLAGNGTSTNSNQYVSALSFSSSASGGSITVNGTNTLLNWATNAITLQQNGATLLQLKKLSTDFVSFGANPAASGFVRGNNSGGIVTGRNVGNSADVTLVGLSSNAVVVGDGANAVNLLLRPGSGNLISFQDGTTEYANFALVSNQARLTIASAETSGLLISQSSTSAATGANITLQSQASTATNGTPGNFVFNTPAPTGSGNTGFSIYQSGGTTIGGIGAWNSSSNNGALWLGRAPVAGVDLTFSILSNSSATQFNSPSGTTLYLEIGTTPYLTLNGLNATWFNGGTMITGGAGTQLIGIGNSGALPNAAPVGGVLLYAFDAGGGQSNLGIFADNLVWNKAQPTPGILHDGLTTDVAATTFTIQAQAAWVSASTNVNGADLVLQGGTSATAASRGGNVRIVGGTRTFNNATNGGGVTLETGQGTSPGDIGFKMAGVLVASLSSTPNVVQNANWLWEDVATSQFGFAFRAKTADTLTLSQWFKGQDAFASATVHKTGGGASLNGGAGTVFAGAIVTCLGGSDTIVGKVSISASSIGCDNTGLPWNWSSASVAMGATGTTTLTSAQYSDTYLILTGTITGAVTLTFPNQGGFWIVDLSQLVGFGATNTVSFKSGTTTKVVVNTTQALNTLDSLVVVITGGSNTISLLASTAAAI